MPRPIRAEVSAAALAQNLTIAKRHAGAAKVWAVLKANAYGHGVERAASALGAADGFAVLDLEEAARLRASGVKKPILLLEGVFEPADVPLLTRHALTPVIHSTKQLDLVARAPFEGGIDVYLKANTGMNRLGFAPDAVRAAYEKMRKQPWVRNITLMTH